jgi:hypothetical protein
MPTVNQGELYFQATCEERREGERRRLLDQFPECKTRLAQVLNPYTMPAGRLQWIDHDVMGIRLIGYCVADIQRRDTISKSHFKGARPMQAEMR